MEDSDSGVELGFLEDVVVAGNATDEQRARYWQLIKERCQLKDDEGQGVDFDAPYDAFNRGDHEDAEHFLASIAGPPRADIERLERSINSALRRASIQPRTRPRPSSRNGRKSRRSTAHRRTRARSPGREDPEPEPPGLARPLSADTRAWLRQEIDRARRPQIARLKTWRECRRCLREQEPEEFGKGCSYCRSCETERVRRYQRERAQVAA